MRVETLGDGEPEYALIGSIHGDEPCGMRAIDQLLRADLDVAEPVALIVANEAAIDTGTRYVAEDLNRAFPGEPEGPTHESRLAAELGARFGDCTVLSLHSTQSYSGPFAIVDGIGELEQYVCPRLAVDAVVDAGDHTDGRIFDGIPRTIEVECGYQGSDTAAANAERVARAFLGAVGVLPAETRPPADGLPAFRLRDPVPKDLAEEYEVYADNFTQVPAGVPFAAADGVDVVADEEFYPVLMSSHGYEHLFGYAADRIGTVP